MLSKIDMVICELEVIVERFKRLYSTHEIKEKIVIQIDVVYLRQIVR